MSSETGTTEPGAADGPSPLGRYSALGALFILGYCVLSAAKEVLIGHAVQDIDPNALVFVSFGLALLLFNAGAATDFRSYAARWRSYGGRRADLALLNVETAIAWGCFFWAVRHLEPAVVSAVTVGLSPFFAQAVGLEKEAGGAIAAKAALSAAVSLALLAATFLGFSAVGAVDPAGFAAGALLCALGAFAIARVTSRARRLYRAGYGAFDLMRTRFFVLVGASGLACLWSGGVEVDGRILATAGIIAIFGVAAPLLALQKGLERCSATVTLLIVASAPGFTWLFQLLDPRLDYSLATIAAIAALFAIAVWSVAGEERAARG